MIQYDRYRHPDSNNTKEIFPDKIPKISYFDIPYIITMISISLLFWLVLYF